MDKSVTTWTIPYVFHFFLAEKQQRHNSMFSTKIFTVRGRVFESTQGFLDRSLRFSAFQRRETSLWGCYSSQFNTTYCLAVLWVKPFAIGLLLQTSFSLQHRQSARAGCSAAPQRRAASTTRNSCLMQAGKIKKPYIISCIFNIRKKYENI